MKENKFTSREDMIYNLCIVSCDTETVVTGYDFQILGTTYNYKPIKDVILFMTFSALRFMVLLDT